MKRGRHHRGNYSFFQRFEYWLPGLGGVAGLLLWLVLGAILGNLLILLMRTLAPDGSLVQYETLISYPVMFIPAMMYASIKSMRLQLCAAPVALDGRFTIDGRSFSRAGLIAISALVCIAATLSLSVLVDPIPMLLPQMPDYLKDALDSLAGGNVVISLLCVSVFAPFFEEWLCRGMVLRGLMSRMKPVWAIVISSLFFALIHMNPWQGIPAFLLGCLFGYVYYRTRSLKLTMLMHCANNTLAVILSNIESFKDMDYIFQAFGSHLVAYSVLMVVCACVFAACIKLISKFSPQNENF